MSNPRCPAVAGAIRSKPLRPALVLLLLLPCLAGAAEPLTLDEALAVAEREAPSLVAAEAAERGANSLVAASESLPDPELLVGLDNVPVTGPDAGSRRASTTAARGTPGTSTGAGAGMGAGNYGVIPPVGPTGSGSVGTAGYTTPGSGYAGSGSAGGYSGGAGGYSPPAPGLADPGLAPPNAPGSFGPVTPPAGNR